MSHHRNPKQQGPFIHKGPQDFGGGSGGGPPPPNRRLVVSFLDPLTPQSFDPEAQTHNTTLHEVLSSAHTESGKALMDAARNGLAAISGHLNSDHRLCNISIFNDIRNQVLEAQSLEQHIEEYKKKNKSAIIKVCLPELFHGDNLLTLYDICTSLRRFPTSHKTTSTILGSKPSES